MKKTADTAYTHRFLARISVEAVTPLAVGSGSGDILTDSLVALDSNGLPYLPATSIAGILRSTLSDTDILFGFQDGDEGRGSEIIFTEGKVVSGEGRVVDGIDPTAIEKDALLSHYRMLPVRQHVRIDTKGTAADTGLFNEQVVFTGTRFCFEVEMVSAGKNFARFEEVLRQLYAADFRIGGGTRSGFGKIKVVNLKVMDLDLMKEEDLALYLAKTSALDTDFWNVHSDRLREWNPKKRPVSQLKEYRLQLIPESFFLFGSGFGDEDADMTPVRASRVEWTGVKGPEGWSVPKGEMKTRLTLIPGSSVKGAVAHRVAFHWNRMQGIYADAAGTDPLKSATGRHNEALRLLFGSEGDGKGKEITRGNVIFSDVISPQLPEKVFNHVAIDRFTGGSLDGALFNEKATYGKRQPFSASIVVDDKGLERACEAHLRKQGKNPGDAPALMARLRKALEESLTDLCTGLLPLGGSVNRGHGAFTGSFTPKTQNGKDNG